MDYTKYQLIVYAQEIRDLAIETEKLLKASHGEAQPEQLLDSLEATEQPEDIIDHNLEELGEMLDYADGILEEIDDTRDPGLYEPETIGEYSMDAFEKLQMVRNDSIRMVIEQHEKYGREVPEPFSKYLDAEDEIL